MARVKYIIEYSTTDSHQSPGTIIKKLSSDLYESFLILANTNEKMVNGRFSAELFRVPNTDQFNNKSEYLF